VATPVVVVAE
jgi:hypothetical protein